MQVIALLIVILIILLLIPYKGEVGGLGKLLVRKKPIWPIFWALTVVFIINLLGFIPTVAHLNGVGICSCFCFVFVIGGSTGGAHCQKQDGWLAKEFSDTDRNSPGWSCSKLLLR